MYFYFYTKIIIYKRSKKKLPPTNGKESHFIFSPSDF